MHPGAPLPPQPVHDPVAPLEEYLEEREEGQDQSQKPKNKSDNDGSSRGIRGRLNLVFAMARDEEQRELHAMRSAARWGVSMFIVGFIFVICSATGAFPTSEENQKDLGIYDDYIVQYCLSMLAGAMAFAAAASARRGLRAGRSTVPEQIAFLLAALIALGIIGLSIWLDVTVNNFESSMWWVWLILVLIILQRSVFALACFFSIWTLRLAAAREGEGKASVAVNKGEVDVV